MENFLTQYYTVEKIDSNFSLANMDEESYFNNLKEAEDRLSPYASKDVLEKLTMSAQIFSPMEVSASLECTIKVGTITISENYDVDEFVSYLYNVEIIANYSNGESTTKNLTGECVFQKGDTKESNLIHVFAPNEPFTTSQLKEYLAMEK